MFSHNFNSLSFNMFNSRFLLFMLPSVSAPCALVVGDVLGVVGTSKPVIGAEGAAAAAEDDADCTSCKSAGGVFG